MSPKLNHIAIAVPDLAAAAECYRRLPGVTVSEPVDLPEHGVTTVFVELANAKIELVHPLGPASPLTRFLERHPKGAIHHFCVEAAQIADARDQLAARGVNPLGDGEPQIGAHGKPVLFFNPADFAGALIELEQA
jgi:methylmalonyl-CoA/ethylmalonyl-CoA epimerase